MKALVYYLHLEQPLLATSLVGDPNSTVSYDYIPGSTLRGLFAHRYLAENQKTSGAGDPLFEHLILSGTVRYLNAYPLTTTQQRALPTPTSLRQRKNAVGKMLDLKNLDPRSTQDWRPVGRPFCLPDKDKPDTERLLLLEPERTLAIHVQRHRPKGRAWIKRHADDTDTETAYGTVFRYEALEAGQYFAGVILIDATDADAEPVEDPEACLTKLINSSPVCWLGRSRSAAYGKVSLTASAPHSNWREVPGSLDTRRELWTLTLLSDTLLRDAQGSFVEQLDSAVLSAYLGVPVELVPELSFVKTTLVGGFNRAWQLPQIQGRALAAGSVISFKPVRSLPDTNSLEWQGIGERRAEGFGRIAFNWLQQTTYQAQKAQVRRQPLTPLTIPQPAGSGGDLPAIARELAAKMGARLFDRLVDQAITAFVQAHVWPCIDKELERKDSNQLLPSNSQLARLRVLVRRTQADGDTAYVWGQFQQFRSPAKRAYEQCSLHAISGSFAQWIEVLLKEPDQVWRLLDGLYVPLVAATPAALPADIGPKAALRLLAAVLAAPAQRRKAAMLHKEAS
jgi:CRISPR-associated protein Csx10